MTDLQTVLAKYPGAETFRFGDNSDLSEYLISLVIAGKKTATCGAASFFEGEGGDALPVAGRRDIALHWNGEPAVVIETTSVKRCRFCDVSEDFALSEGENETREGWARDHQRFFERNGGFDPRMELICERFKVVEVLGGNPAD